MKSQAYEVIQTADGSPSLKAPDNDTIQSETMHNRAGAYSETQYIYGEALRSKSEASQWRVMVVGLGLGYIELLSMAEALKLGKGENLRIRSYESDPLLVSTFLNWLRGEACEFSDVYDSIFRFFKRDYPHEAPALKAKLLDLYNQRRWLIEGLLDSHSLYGTADDQKFNIILYDAFSSKSTPEIWTAEFLDQFLNQLAAPDAVFATYACTGVLKRTLQSHRFSVTKRPGFSGKRDCTFAERTI